MNDSHHRLSPVDGRHPSLLEEGASGGHHRLVAALHDIVLLWSVPHREVALDPLIDAVRRELSRLELAAVVSAKHKKLAAALLHINLMASALSVEQDCPHVAGHIIDK